MELSSLSEEKLIVLLQEMNNFDEINYFFIREAHIKSHNEMEELKRFQGSTFDEFFEKKIDRKSRHYPWTHGQNSGTTEWS